MWAPMEDEDKETFLAMLRRPNNVGHARFHELDSRHSHWSSSLIEAGWYRRRHVYDIFTTSVTLGGQVLIPANCTIGLNLGHPPVNYNMWAHCPICHCWAHTIDQCEYNLLNRSSVLVQRIKLQHNGRQPNEWILCWIFGFILYTHLLWSSLFPFGSSSSSYAWFSCKESISSYMALNHLRLWVSLFASSKRSCSPSLVSNT